MIDIIILKNRRFYSKVSKTKKSRYFPIQGILLQYWDLYLSNKPRRNRIDNIKNWTSGITAKTFSEDERNMLAVYKAFQEIIESSMDICAMILKI